MATPFPARIAKKFIKRFTFAAVAGQGAQGTVLVGTVTGSIRILEMALRVVTDLTGASATIAFGTVGNTAAIIAATTGTSLDAGQFWQDTSPETGVSPGITNLNVCANLQFLIATADLTGGVIEVVAYWLPLSDDGNLV